MPDFEYWRLAHHLRPSQAYTFAWYEISLLKFQTRQFSHTIYSPADFGFAAAVDISPASHRSTH